VSGVVHSGHDGIRESKANRSKRPVWTPPASSGALARGME